MSETIAAIASGSVVSAIGIIRISGDDAIRIADELFVPQKGARLSDRPDRSLVLGELRNERGEVLDLCLCTISRAPNSYTGENTAEFQCHGSPTVLRLALEAIFARGARQALAGEFTKRAFLNGRMDLTQAEAVIDLIESETAEAAKNAAGQLGGAVFRKIDTIYGKLVDIMSHFYAVLDYPDEDINDFAAADYIETFKTAERALNELLQTFERGKIMKSGVKAAIVGRPNAGKSSLLNALLGYDRAIVTDIPGTTRDTIEESVVLGGVRLCLTDTAGLRGTDDPIERIGVERALDAAKSSELLLAVFDGSVALSDEDFDAMEASKTVAKSIAIINKCDLPQVIDYEKLSEFFDNICRVSAVYRTGLELLEQKINSLYPMPQIPAGEILTNSRQADAVRRAIESISAAILSLESGATPDIVLTETENALNALGELTGKTVREDVTERIFHRFCVGK